MAATAEGSMQSPYRPLATSTQEIRILELDTSQPMIRMRGSLLHIPINEAEQYIALSYVWGQGNPTDEIQIDGQNVAITPSLNRAMQHILSLPKDLAHDNSPKHTRPRFWIDQICINQKDNAEKVTQIPLMYRIYARASTVLLWLGEGTKTAPIAFAYLRRLSDELARGTDDEFMSRTDLLRLFDMDGWNAVVTLLELPWFHRRWVVQEAATTRTAMFMCGRMCIPYIDFDRAIRAFSEVESRRTARDRRMRPIMPANVTPVWIITFLQNEGANSSRAMSLLKLLELVRNNMTSEPHDRIFALLGLCNPTEAHKIAIDYGEPWQWTFTKSVVAHIEVHQTLEFLGACAFQSCLTRDTDSTHLSTLSRPSWPSWVPDWTSNHAIRRLGPDGEIDRCEYSSVFDASRGLRILQIDTRILGGKGELNVSVIPLDHIARIDQWYQGEAHNSLWNDPASELWIQYFKFCFSPPLQQTLYRTEKERIDAFVATLAHGGRSGEILLDFETVKAKFRTFFKGTDLLHKLTEMGLQCESQDTKPMRSLSFRLKYFKLVTTGSGRVAITRFGCWAGDKVCVVSGCSTPLLLRGPIRDQQHYIVRGEVYLDGFMHGEAVEYAKQHGIKTEQWTLV